MRNTVALITGAPTGIGRTAAMIFAQEGANIVVSGRQDKQGQELVTELVQHLLPTLGEGSNIMVISSLGGHGVVGKPGVDNPSLLRLDQRSIGDSSQELGRHPWAPRYPSKMRSRRV